MPSLFAIYPGQPLVRAVNPRPTVPWLDQARVWRANIASPRPSSPVEYRHVSADLRAYTRLPICRRDNDWVGDRWRGRWRREWTHLPLQSPRSKDQRISGALVRSLPTQILAKISMVRKYLRRMEVNPPPPLPIQLSKWGRIASTVLLPKWPGRASHALSIDQRLERAKTAETVTNCLILPLEVSAFSSPFFLSSSSSVSCPCRSWSWLSSLPRWH